MEEKSEVDTDLVQTLSGQGTGMIYRYSARRTPLSHEWELL